MKILYSHLMAHNRTVCSTPCVPLFCICSCTVRTHTLFINMVNLLPAYKRNVCNRHDMQRNLYRCAAGVSDLRRQFYRDEGLRSLGSQRSQSSTAVYWMPDVPDALIGQQMLLLTLFAYSDALASTPLLCLVGIG